MLPGVARILDHFLRFGFESGGNHSGFEAFRRVAIETVSSFEFWMPTFALLKGIALLARAKSERGTASSSSPQVIRLS
jgi:hypothetical protein